jgi:hypothetical protein
MMQRQSRMAALLTFSTLGAAYIGTIVLVLSASGLSSLLSPTLQEEWVLLASISLRLLGAVLCALVVFSLASLPRLQRLGLFSAWALTICVTVVLVWNAVAVRSSVNAFAIIGVIVALHLLALRSFYQASRQ